MKSRRVVALITMLIATLTLLNAPTVEAGKRPWRCRNDEQCKAGTCNDAGQCYHVFVFDPATGDILRDAAEVGMSAKARNSLRGNRRAREVLQIYCVH